MSQDNKYLSVSALNRYIAYKLDNDIHLRRILIKGEISNIRLSGGHYYFILKDEESEISCIMFNNYHKNLKFELKDGMRVLIEAKLSVYTKRGTYSLQVFQIEEDGLGQLYIQFLQLKEKLEKEGLFDPKYKKPIPEYLEKIGIITSATGDALHDIIQTINKRFPLATLYLYPSLVQGEDAPRDLIRNIRKANLDEIVEVIIIGRGGGSFEDLSCFNDELLAREIFNSKIPIVSAVGHESDFTICDFVADFRAPTPTGAAVKVTKDKRDIIRIINDLTQRLNHLIKTSINEKENKLVNLQNSYGLKNFLDIITRKEEYFNQMNEKLTIYSPLNKINQNIIDVNNLSIRLNNIKLIDRIQYYQDLLTSNNNILSKYIINSIDFHNQTLLQAIDKLIILNPLNLLNKGYTIACQDGQIVRSVKKVNEDIPLEVRFKDGTVTTKILYKSEESIDG